MSLQSKPVPEVPKLPGQIARSAFPKGNLYMQMSDRLGTLFENEQFSALFSRTGQPAIAAWRLALVTIMQLRDTTAVLKT